MTALPGITRVAVVEDDPRYRQGLETLLRHSTGFGLAASYGAPQSLLREAGENQTSGASAWDVVLMDVELPGMDGIEATRRLKAITTDVAVVVLTVFEEPATILDAICAGADGYLLKKTPAAQLLAHIRSVAGGGSPLTPAVARKVLGLVRGEGRRQPSASPSRLDLTEREQEVLRGLVQGLAYKQVADHLGISLDTVRTHIRGVYRKLQVHSVAEAVSRAIREGLI